MPVGPPSGKPPWSQHVRDIWTQLLAIAVPGAGGLAAAYGSALFPPLLVGWFVVLLVADRIVYAEDVRVRFRPHVPHGARRAGPVLRPVLAVVAGAAVAVAGWIAVPQVTSLGGGRCAPPPVVRVMAAPENHDAVRAEVAPFIEHEAELGDGCVPARVTVFEAPPPGDLDEAFQGAWDLSRWPHPDVWVPATSAAVSLATGESRPGERPDGTWTRARADRAAARLRTDGRFGAPSPLVIAASRQVVESLGLTGAESLSWDGLRGESTRLLVPRPEATESGLAGMFALFTGSTGGDGASKARRRELLGMVDRSGAVPDDPGELLCRLRGLDGDGSTIAAAFVPMASVEAYNSGQLCGVSVLPQEEQLVALRPTGWTPAVDRPIVRVRWGGDDTEGNRLADRFGAWLSRHGPSPAKGPAGSLLTSAQLTQSRELMAEARQPLSIEFMLDYSATMNGRTRGGTRLTTALTVVENALARLGRGDQVGLWRFPGGPAERAPALLVPRASAAEPQAARIGEKLEGLRHADAGTTPLFHAIAVAAERGTGRRALAVLTDGQDDDPADGGGVSTRQALRNALDDADSPHVYVLVLARAGCGKDLVALEHALPKFHCIGGDESADATLDALFAAL